MRNWSIIPNGSPFFVVRNKRRAPKLVTVNDKTTLGFEEYGMKLPIHERSEATFVVRSECPESILSTTKALVNLTRVQ